MRLLPLLAAAVLLAAPTAGLAQTAPPAEVPFTRPELLQHLRANVPYWADPAYGEACQEAASAVRRRGIAFSYDGSFDEELHSAGACPAVLTAMQESALQAEIDSLQPSGAPCGDGVWCPGDRVEAYEWGWYPASVIEQGTGTHAGDYKVLFDGHSIWKWVRAENVRAAGETEHAAPPPAPLAEAEEAIPAVKPRLGRYQIWSYGDLRNPLLLGYVELGDGGVYRVLDRSEQPIGSGHYRFEPRASAIRWEDGPYADAYERSDFETKRNGVEHVLRLNRVTIASNSTD